MHSYMELSQCAGQSGHRRPCEEEGAHWLSPSSHNHFSRRLSIELRNLSLQVFPKYLFICRRGWMRWNCWSSWGPCVQGKKTRSRECTTLSQGGWEILHWRNLRNQAMRRDEELEHLCNGVQTSWQLHETQCPLAEAWTYDGCYWKHLNPTWWFYQGVLGFNIGVSWTGEACGK